MVGASRQSVRAALLAGVAAVAGCSHAPRPDVLLVTIDTLRSDHCSSYGYGIPTTPNLDALAARGVRYARAYAESSTTAPSHAVIMTGRHFRTFGLTKNGASLMPGEVTLAETLHDSGYASAGFVSSFPLNRRFGFAQGFEVFDDKFVIDEASLGMREPGHEAQDRVAAATVDHLANWFDKRTDTRPLFLWVHFVDPHAPYDAPESLDATWPEGAPTHVRRYDAEVHYADAQLGRLLALFAEKTPERPDLVVVTSDHGEGLGDHQWMNHGINLHEEAVHVPLVASWPGVLPEGKLVEDPVGIIDIAPSILDLLAIEAPTFAHGRNLFGKPEADRRIFLQRREYKKTYEKGRRIRGDMTGVVDRVTKLIVAPGEHRRELYDLAADPGELRDLLSRRPQSGNAVAKAAQTLATKPPDPAAAGPLGTSSPAAVKAADAGVPQPTDNLATATAAAASVPSSERAAYEASARKLNNVLTQWQKAFSAVPIALEPTDTETLKALRSLGYVD